MLTIVQCNNYSVAAQIPIPILRKNKRVFKRMFSNTFFGWPGNQCISSTLATMTNIWANVCLCLNSCTLTMPGVGWLMTAQHMHDSMVPQSFNFHHRLPVRSTQRSMHGWCVLHAELCVLSCTAWPATQPAQTSTWTSKLHPPTPYLSTIFWMQFGHLQNGLLNACLGVYWIMVLLVLPETFQKQPTFTKRFVWCLLNGLACVFVFSESLNLGPPPPNWWRATGVPQVLFHPPGRLTWQAPR